MKNSFVGGQLWQLVQRAAEWHIEWSQRSELDIIFYALTPMRSAVAHQFAPNLLHFSSIIHRWTGHILPFTLSTSQTLPHDGWKARLCLKVSRRPFALLSFALNVMCSGSIHGVIRWKRPTDNILDCTYRNKLKKEYYSVFIVNLYL